MGDCIRKGQDFIYREPAQYRIIRINLPEAPVDEVMPKQLIFYADTRFTPEQMVRIRELLNDEIYFWRTHFEELEISGVSEMQQVVRRYARFNFSPVWYKRKIANGSAAVTIMMNALTEVFAANGFGRAPRSYIKYAVPKKGKDFTIIGCNAETAPESTSLTILINPMKLSRQDLGGSVLVGSLFHAWLHRLGYKHPQGKFTSYFSAEVGLAIMRALGRKVPGEPDSRYTPYFD